MKRVTLIEMHLNENLYSSPDTPAFPIQNSLKQRNALSPFLFKFLLEETIENGKP
jgi:hypothetical protein